MWRLSINSPALMTAPSDWDFLFKYVVVGDPGVGKTCLLMAFMNRAFRSSHDVTIGVEFGSRTVQLGGHSVKLQVWDTAGQECFRSVARAYYRGAAVALLVYDVTNRSSFEHVELWMGEVETHAAHPPLLVLVGNKLDRAADRCVTREEGEALARKFGALFQETSAKADPDSVDAAYLRSAEAVLEKALASPPEILQWSAGVIRSERLAQQQARGSACC